MGSHEDGYSHIYSVNYIWKTAGHVSCSNTIFRESDSSVLPLRNPKCGPVQAPRTCCESRSSKLSLHSRRGHLFRICNWCLWIGLVFWCPTAVGCETVASRLQRTCWPCAGHSSPNTMLQLVGITTDLLQCVYMTSVCDRKRRMLCCPHNGFRKNKVANSTTTVGLPRYATRLSHLSVLTRLKNAVLFGMNGLARCRMVFVRIVSWKSRW